MSHERSRETEGELGDALQRIISDTLINHRTIKLCLHSTTIVSILNDKEGNEEEKK